MNDQTEHTPSPIQEAVEQLRVLTDQLLRLDPSAAVAPTVAERLAEVARLVTPYVDAVHDADAVPDADAVSSADSSRGERPSRGAAVASAPPAQTWRHHLDRSPVTGTLNAMAPPVEVTFAEDGVARCVANLGLPYQGPPGRVHGGWVTTLLDHVMGASAHTTRAGLSVTRSLTVDFDDAVPLFEEFTVTGRVDRVEGRKIWMLGEITCGRTVRARARGLWIVIVPGPPQWGGATAAAASA